MGPGRRRGAEASFTVLETVFAMSLMLTVIAELVSAQTNVVYLANYSHRMVEATYLAKRIMAQIEYRALHYPFSDLKVAGVKDNAFENFDNTDYTYAIELDDWKIDIFGLLEKSQEAEGGDSDSSNDRGGFFDLVKQRLGDELFKVAAVEVSWPEGAKKNSVSLTYVLTNQQALDKELALLQKDYKEVKDKIGLMYANCKDNEIYKDGQCQACPANSKPSQDRTKCERTSTSPPAGNNNNNNNGTNNNAGDESGDNSGNQNNGADPDTEAQDEDN